MYDKSFFEDLLSKSYEEREDYLDNCCSIADLEGMACELYNHYPLIRDCYAKRLSHSEGIDCLFTKILETRVRKLNRNFVWNEQNKKHLQELNNKVINGFKLAYDEAKTLHEILLKRKKANDQFLNDFEIKIKLVPFILEFNKKDGILEEGDEDSIYYILYTSFPKYLWEDKLVKDIEDQISIPRYIAANQDMSANSECFDGNGDVPDDFVCYAIHDLEQHYERILSWYDILKINEIWVEVNVTHQHFLENIGKDEFWDNGIQSLSDNEAENLRQEYMSRLSKNITGLPVELFVDEMDAWETIGPYKRVKFQGNKNDKKDFRKIYSMSIEQNPQILVKDAEIDLTDNELKQVKDFVSINRNNLLRMAKGEISVIDFMETLGKSKEKNNMTMPGDEL